MNQDQTGERYPLILELGMNSRDYLIRCPFCGCEHSRIVEVYTRLGSFTGSTNVYKGTQVKGQAEYGARSLEIVFRGGCSHQWRLVLQDFSDESYIEVAKMRAEPDSTPCIRCGRPLHDHESVSSGLGPRCAAKIGREVAGDSAN
jgi:hypothetical protein